MSDGASGRVAPAAAVRIQFDLNTRLFTNALADLDEVDATARPNGHTNNVAFIAGHLVESRAWTARLAGANAPAPFGGVLEHAMTIDDVGTLPRLDAIRAAWPEVTASLAGALELLDAGRLEAPTSQRFPGVPDTMLGALVFLGHHEAYHIGQLGLLRKYLGLEAMAYK